MAPILPVRNYFTMMIYLYVCIDGINWRRVSLGAAF